MVNKVTLYFLNNYGVNSTIGEAMVRKENSRYYVLLSSNAWLGSEGEIVYNNDDVSEDRSVILDKAKRQIIDGINNNMTAISRGRDNLRKLLS